MYIVQLNWQNIVHFKMMDYYLLWRKVCESECAGRNSFYSSDTEVFLPTS